MDGKKERNRKRNEGRRSIKKERKGERKQKKKGWKDGDEMMGGWQLTLNKVQTVLYLLAAMHVQHSGHFCSLLLSKLY